VSSRELQSRAAAGELRPTDRVSPDRKKWVPASRVKGLTFTETTPPPAATALIPPGEFAASQVGAPTPAPTNFDTIDTSIDQVPGYELVGVLGKGACGVVFRARQVKLDRVVALKMVLSDRRPSAAALARFDKEAVSLAKLKHPNIVGVYDCGHQNGRAFFAMELLDGEDLAARSDRAGPLDEFTAWHVARQTAAALAHAADLGVYHRDIKPANLFLVPPPTGYPLPPGVPLVKVTDFGLALTRQTGDEATDHRLTAAGVVLGTPVYMPPEQFAGSKIDHRADIYALGATLYHVLSGQAPFEGGSVWEVMLKKSEPVPRLRAPLSPETVQLVAAMMAREPADRVGSYRELLDRIDALPCMKTSGVTAAAPAQPLGPIPVAAPERNRTKLYVFAALGGLALVTAVALGVKYLGDKQEPPAPSGETAKAGGFATGAREELFNHETLLGWSPVGGVSWTIEEDDEKVSVLTGKGGVRRPFRAAKKFRVLLGIDLHEATAAEVVIAVADGPPEAAKRWAVRLDRKTGAAFGTRDGERGSFIPIGPARPVPTRQELLDQGSAAYPEVRYERAGGKLRAWYRGQLLGEANDDGTPKTTEVRVLADGGAIRIDTAALEELIEQK
jgi:hypothetical protein